MSHLPLLEAVRYLAREAGLKVRVEPYAVALVPLTEDADPLLDATFRVSPDFIPNRTTGGGAVRSTRLRPGRNDDRTPLRDVEGRGA